jgi:hypothetical protein
MAARARGNCGGKVDLFPFGIHLRLGQYWSVGQERSCVDLTAVQHSDVLWQHRNDIRHSMLTSTAPGTVTPFALSCLYAAHKRLKVRVKG